MYKRSLENNFCIMLNPAFINFSSIIDEGILICIGGPPIALSVFSNSKHRKYPPSLSTRLICCSVLDNGSTSCKTNEASTISIELSDKEYHQYFL